MGCNVWFSLYFSFFLIEGEMCINLMQIVQTLIRCRVLCRPMWFFTAVIFSSLGGRHSSSTAVLAKNKRSRTVSAEAKYDGQSRQEAKIGEYHYIL